jgi:hypothetical protein
MEFATDFGLAQTAAARIDRHRIVVVPLRLLAE